MFDYPLTAALAHARRYNTWAGNPDGSAFVPTRCAAEVADGGRSVLFHQCGNAPGYGPDSLYCRVHARKAKHFAEKFAARESQP